MKQTGRPENEPIKSYPSRALYLATSCTVSFSLKAKLRPRPQVVSNMLRIRTLVLQHIAKQDEEKTTDFLCATPCAPPHTCSDALAAVLCCLAYHRGCILHVAGLPDHGQVTSLLIKALLFHVCRPLRSE